MPEEDLPRHVVKRDGRAVPFCAYNALGYREAVRREQEARP